LAELLFQT